jgi:aspartokinase/homoserine dehydrogenase 1
MEDNMIVHKFGGTSVGNAQQFASVADIVIDHHNRASGTAPGETVVVVSAITGVTDQLIAGARAAAEGKDSVYRDIKAGLLSRHLEIVEALLTHSRERLGVGGLVEDRLHELERFYRSIAMLGELTVRGRDAIASFGEQLSANILAAVLRERGLRAQAVNATELIVTDDHFGAATPVMDQTGQQLRQRIGPLVERGVVPVITGYVAATEKGVTTTLGRGGSDFSAAIIGAGLAADEVWIWSDVDGILTADPNLVPHARTLTELSYAEAADLAYYGAEVLHPKTIRPVTEQGIPLRILNSYNPSHRGTLIVQSPSVGRELLPAIISTTGLSLIAIGSQDDSWALPMAARALHRLSEAGVDVLMFSQSFSEHCLNLVVREQDQVHCLRALSREFEHGRPGSAYQLGTKEQVATVSVVGVPGWNENGIVSHTFAALGKHGTGVIAVAQAATEYSVSFCIPGEQMPETVRFLHRELGLEGKGAQDRRRQPTRERQGRGAVRPAPGKRSVC